jgi:hypothetical protein
MVRIIWTDRAKLDYWNNIEYLETEWTIKEVVRFPPLVRALGFSGLARAS